jgi:hypothetical protein
VSCIDLVTTLLQEEKLNLAIWIGLVLRSHPILNESTWRACLVLYQPYLTLFTLPCPFFVRPGKTFWLSKAACLHMTRGDLTGDPNEQLSSISSLGDWQRNLLQAIITPCDGNLFTWIYMYPIYPEIQDIEHWKLSKKLSGIIDCSTSSIYMLTF